MFHRLTALLVLLPLTFAQDAKFLIVTEPDNVQQDHVQKFVDGFSKVQSSGGITLDEKAMAIDRDNEEAAFNSTCDALAGEQFSAIIDLTFGGWKSLMEAAKRNNFPYIRLDATNHQFVQAGDDYLRDRGAIDAALIFKTEADLDSSLYYLIGNSYVRVIVVNLEEADALDRLAKMRPSPSYYVAHGDTDTIKEIYKQAQNRNLVKRDARWTFVFHDWKTNQFPKGDLGAQVTFIEMTEDDCCTVKDESGNCNCANLMSPTGAFLEKAGMMVAETLKTLKQSGQTLKQSMTCSASAAGSLASSFESGLNSKLGSSEYKYMSDKQLLYYPLEMTVTARNSSFNVEMGTWNKEMGFKKAANYEHSPIPRFFRIGTVPTTPWAYYKLDSNGRAMKDAEGKVMLEGYCVDFIEELSKRMYFDYELILPTDNTEDYGAKGEDGRWTGIIGDLVNGEIDIAVAGMTMTSEREEVVDFVAPYFDQSGISIIIRKPVRPRSLFKFMEVLRVEVWMAILAALVVTALMLWFLDRFSPYSARNNKEAHPYPCREFTLKESFWFALTSFTPQGGGEAPKSLSGRVLVAAYWLFVVLMLATFTANLAAFLTVERMQSTVQSLEALAQQSKINYTVVSDSPYYEYFKNMAGAEEDLYRVWKDLTLSSNADQSKYRVWDYPIKEQYTHIYKTIKASGMARDSEEGFKRVLEDEQGTFAFIHDASQIRYEYYNNCNFTEVGEPFAEQPYAVAVQQGSHLQEEISKVILELQKDRYFETLSSHYWNSTLRSLCPTLDDSEGITLRSLGGVFIATLVGLGIAMIVLAFEVYFHKKEQTNAVEDISQSNSRILQVGSVEKPRISAY